MLRKRKNFIKHIAAYIFIIIFAAFYFIYLFFSPDNNTVKLYFMEYRVFKSSSERKLFKLYLALDYYFKCGDPVTPTGFHDKTGNVLPFLFQCISEFWCKGKNDYIKIIKK